MFLIGNRGFRFSAKLRERRRDFPCLPAPHAGTTFTINVIINVKGAALRRHGQIVSVCLLCVCPCLSHRCPWGLVLVVFSPHPTASLRARAPPRSDALVLSAPHLQFSPSLGFHTCTVSCSLCPFRKTSQRHPHTPYFSSSFSSLGQILVFCSVP